MKRVGRIGWLPGFAVRGFAAGLIALFILGLSGCGGSSSQPIGVSLTSSVAGSAIDQAQTVAITATVANDSKSAGVMWSVSGSGSQGTLSGQTTTSVTYNAPSTVTTAFTATVTATSITDATKSATLQIKVNPLPSITTTSLPAATAGVGYTGALTVSGGTSPYTWTITSGTLPAGLVLNSASGLIVGTVTGASSTSLTFKVTDEAGNSSSRALTLTVNPPPALVISTASLPGAALGVAYSQMLQATGGVPAYSWSITSGSLPAGLSLSSAGVISGTPSGSTGTSNFTVKVTDSQTPTPATSSANLSITVSIAPLTITTTSLTGGVTGKAYNQTLQANGGNPPYSWSITLGSLPAGLSLNASTGAITGTPTATGTSSFTVKVTDSALASATANLSITINGALAITTTSLPGGSVGATYSSTVQANGGVTSYTWKVTSGSLPAGLSLNTSSGNISGTPTATGTSNFTIQVTDSESPAVTVSKGLSITIGAQGCTNNGTLSGNYAFVASGWSSSVTAMSIGGSFLADGNGHITAGFIDVADQGAATTTESGTFTGTYCVNSNNLATMNLTYGGGLSGSNTFAAALDASDSNGHIISYDSSARKVSGLLRKQNTTAFSTSKIDGNYALGMAGADEFGSRFGIAGAVSFNGSGAISGVDDSDTGGVVQTSQTLSATNFSVVATGASAGRGTATITSTLGNTNFAFYVVSTSEMLTMAFDTTETPPIILAGQVLQQSGTFTDASLDGVSVIELQSLGSNIEPTVAAGLFTTTGNSATYTYSADENQGGTMSTPSDSGTFSVSANGRVHLVSTGGNFPPVLYLVAPNQAFVVGTDAGVSFGTMEPQTGSGFNASSFTGNYLGGSRPPTSANVSEEADYLNANGTNAVTGTSAQNSSTGPESQTISAAYSVSSNGRVVMSEGGAPILYLYIVSPSQAVALSVSSTQNPDTAPRLIDFHQ